MLRSLPLTRSLATLCVLAIAACSEAPVAPTPPRLQPPAAVDPSILTPFLLPPGADWGLYFVSFNPDRNLTADVIHYTATNSASGKGTFLIPGFGSGVLRITSAEGYGGSPPNGTGTSGPPESANASGVAILFGPVPQLIPFRLDLHSNFWPNPENNFDTATISFASGCASPPCTFAFYGELHHEPQ